jgi:phage recombination protein Bet
MAQQAVAIVPRLKPPADFNGTPGQWRVLCEAIWPNARTADAISLAVSYCAARKLDPMKRPVHIVPMWNTALGKQVETVWPGINELLTTASRSGGFAGVDEPRWGPEQTKTFRGMKKIDNRDQPFEITLTFPVWCGVTVWRIVGGERRAFSQPVYWMEAYARLGFGSELPNDMWSKRTRGQLHKCALAASLRLGFPEDIGGQMSGEEMEGREIDSGGFTIEGSVERDAATTRDNIDDQDQRTSVGGSTAGELREGSDRSASADPSHPDEPPERVEGVGSFRIALPGPEGERTVQAFANTIDWLAKWDQLIARHKGDPNDLRALRALNGQCLYDVSLLDLAASMEVEGKLDRLLDNPNGRRTTR